MIKSLILLFVVCVAILGAAYMFFPKITKPDYANRGIPQTCAKLPEFTDYPEEVRSATLPWIVWDTNAKSREMQETIGTATSSAVNFAGNYILVSESCGAECQRHAVVQADNGRVSLYGLMSKTGLDYRPDSRLLVVNPTPGLSQPTLYYDFQGVLKYLCEAK